MYQTSKGRSYVHMQICMLTKHLRRRSVWIRVRISCEDSSGTTPPHFRCH